MLDFEFKERGLGFKLYFIFFIDFIQKLAVVFNDDFFSAVFAQLVVLDFDVKILNSSFIYSLLFLNHYFQSLNLLFTLFLRRHVLTGTNIEIIDFVC